MNRTSFKSEALEALYIGRKFFSELRKFGNTGVRTGDIAFQDFEYARLAFNYDGVLETQVITSVTLG